MRVDTALTKIFYHYWGAETIRYSIGTDAGNHSATKAVCIPQKKII